MKKTYFKKAFLVPAVLSVIIMSCTKDKVSEKAPDLNSPAFQIAETEKLIIPASIDLPANLPNGNKRVVTFFADGVQKYKAQEVAGSDPVAYEWVFVAPQADLYDASNNKVGTHTAGPNWQLSAADSMFGQSFNPARPAPGNDPSTIDWLLLMPKTGKTPTGVFADVSYVQRIATKGGKAPTTPPVNATATVDVKYTAIYRFTKKN